MLLLMFADDARQPEKASIAQRCAARREDSKRTGGSLFNHVACIWLRKVVFFCWRALAVSRQMEKEADQELCRADAISYSLAVTINHRRALCNMHGHPRSPCCVEELTM
jgi:hypothetical protein